jgi:hypothetical protein
MKFKEKGKHKARPITQQRRNRWHYKYFRYQDKFQIKHKYDKNMSNSDLHILVSPVHLMPSVYCVTKLRKQFYGSQHLHTKHTDRKDKPTAFFKHKYEELKYSQTYLTPVIKCEGYKKYMT